MKLVSLTAAVTEGWEVALVLLEKVCEGSTELKPVAPATAEGVAGAVPARVVELAGCREVKPKLAVTSAAMEELALGSKLTETTLATSDVTGTECVCTAAEPLEV